MKHENQDENKKREALDMLGMRYPRWDNRVIRSLGDEEHVDPNERMVADCRQDSTKYEWSHGFDESEWSLNTSRMLRFGALLPETRWTFLEANVPVVVSLMVPLVTPVNEVQMKPRLMMAALITGAQTEYRESAMFANPPESLRAGGLKKTTDVRPIVRDGSGSPQLCGARRRRQSTISKGFINRTESATAATTPCCTIEITCN